MLQVAEKFQDSPLGDSENTPYGMADESEIKSETLKSCAKGGHQCVLRQHFGNGDPEHCNAHNMNVFNKVLPKKKSFENYNNDNNH